MTDRIPQFHPILHAAQLIGEKLREDFALSGGTPTQGRVLDIIDRLENPVPARVGEALDLTASAMSQMIKRLRKAGLIEPSSRTKGRAYFEPLVLSDTGIAVLRHAQEAWDRVEQQLIEIIGQDAMESMFHSSYDIVLGLGSEPPFPREIHLLDGKKTEADQPVSE